MSNDDQNTRGRGDGAAPKPAPIFTDPRGGTLLPPRGGSSAVPPPAALVPESHPVPAPEQDDRVPRHIIHQEGLPDLKVMMAGSTRTADEEDARLLRIEAERVEAEARAARQAAEAQALVAAQAAREAAEQRRSRRTRVLTIVIVLVLLSIWATMFLVLKYHNSR